MSQQVKDGGQLYVDLACVRCHAPNGVGGIPNRLNVGGDSTIPPLNNPYRDETEQFRTAVQITQVLDEGSIVSKKPGVINMPSWKGVITTAQADALAAYILAGLPNAGAAYDADPAEAVRHLHAPTPASTATGRWGSTRRRRRRQIRKTADKTVPGSAQPRRRRAGRASCAPCSWRARSRTPGRRA